MKVELLGFLADTLQSEEVVSNKTTSMLQNKLNVTNYY